jgi:hypothetical protein
MLIIHVNVEADSSIFQEVALNAKTITISMVLHVFLVQMELLLLMELYVRAIMDFSIFLENVKDVGQMKFIVTLLKLATARMDFIELVEHVRDLQPI